MAVKKILTYLRARLFEHSTIAAVSAAIPTAAALRAPWCWFALLGALVVALVPQRTGDA